MLDKFQRNDDYSKVLSSQIISNYTLVLGRRPALTSINSQKCQFCISQPQPTQIIHDLYYDKFNFYFAKPINEILANCQTPHTILYYDLTILDSYQENLKRFYLSQSLNHFYPSRYETTQRLQILSSFYSKTFHKPNLVLHRQSQNMDKRQRKLNKLKSETKVEQNRSNDPLPQQILGQLNTDNLKCTSNSQGTFETIQHDIYSKFISQNGDLEKSHRKTLSFANFTLFKEQEKLYDVQDCSQLDEVFSQVNVISEARLTPLVKQQRELEISEYQSYPIHKFLKKKKEGLTLNIEKIEKMNKKGNIVHMMQQFKKIPNKSLKSKFYEQVKGFYTERHNDKKNPSISPSFVNLNSIALKDNYKFGKKNSEKQVKSNVWLTYEKSNNNEGIKKKLQELSSTCEQTSVNKRNQKNEKEKGEQEKLLKLLRQQNTSQPVSPHRKLEIKLNLNKLIVEQQSILNSGYWTQRKQEDISEQLRFPVKNLKKANKGQSQKQRKSMRI